MSDSIKYSYCLKIFIRLTVEIETEETDLMTTNLKGFIDLSYIDLD